MQVQQLPISKFLKTANSLVIPVYQRDYTWKKQNCEKLWSDIQELVLNKRHSHFLGTIVTINHGYGKYLVIDGQQRLTTITIFLLALSHYLADKASPSDEDILLQKIFRGYLVDEESIEQDTRIKLKPNKSDFEYFGKLFDNTKDIPENNSNIISNYLYFRSEFEKEALSPRKIFEDGLQKLDIVSIDLSKGQDDPQLIFESLNATGVDLNAGDLIRNYILMDLEPVQQEQMYRKYWIEIEKKTTSDIAEFVRNYLIFKLKIWVKKDDVYEEFKKLSEESFYQNKEGILQDLLFFAEIYSWLIQAQNHPNQEINEELTKLNRLEFTVCYPYLLDVFSELNLKNIDVETTKDILIIIESYAFRKILVDNTTQGLNKLFISLARDIKKEESWKKQYINILNYILLEKRGSQRFPSDDEFESALINKEIYKLQSKNRNFLLESLENYKSAYPVSLDELTVEHIMPQTLTKEWKNKLGENWQEIHNKYLHTLGNLSLTAKNSELSNNSFDDKQRIDFQTSKIKLNYKLDGLMSWDDKIMLERAKDLTKNARDIWPYPQTTYSKPVPEEQLFDLTSSDNFSGSKPSRLYFENDINGIELKTWRDLLVGTCNYLYDFSPTQFSELQKNLEFKWYFNVDKPLKTPLEFRPNEFVEGNMSANGIVSFLLKICERLAYQPENIQFSIKSGKE